MGEGLWSQRARSKPASISTKLYTVHLLSLNPHDCKMGLHLPHPTARLCGSESLGREVSFSVKGPVVNAWA